MNKITKLFVFVVAIFVIFSITEKVFADTYSWSYDSTSLTFTMNSDKQQYYPGETIRVAGSIISSGCANHGNSSVIHNTRIDSGSGRILAGLSGSGGGVKTFVTCYTGGRGTYTFDVLDGSGSGSLNFTAPVALGAHNINANLSMIYHFNYYACDIPYYGSLSVPFTVIEAPTAIPFIDIGLRINEGTSASPNIKHIAIEDPTTPISSPVRIVKGGVEYRIALVDPNDSNATNIKVKTNTGIKAFRVCTSTDADCVYTP